MHRRSSSRLFKLDEVIKKENEANRSDVTYSFSPLLIFSWAFKLWRMLKSGGKWAIALARGLLFVTTLLPAFLPLALTYLTSKFVKSARYGRRARNSLDIYLPPDNTASSRRPVVVFLSGGMWTIGYKAWGMIMGRRLADHGCVGVCVDYRNYPQTNIVGMLEDHRDALIWIHTHINQYGGDPDNIWVVGQSAGAHLSALLMLLQAKASEVVARAAADLTDSSANDLDSAEFEPPVASCSSQWQPTSHLFATTDAILDDVDLSSFNLTASLAASGPVLQSCFDSRVLVSPAVLKLMPRIRGWVGIAGPYQISSPYLTYIETRGLNRSFLHDIFWDAVPKRQIVQSDGSTLLQDDLQAASSVDPIQERARHDEVESHLWTLSPICLVQRDTDLRACWQHLPPVFLLHGECDLSVPYEASWNFATALLHLSTPTSEAHIQQCNSSTSSSSALPIYLRRYSGMTHTDPIIEAPMRGRDPLMADLLSIVHRSGYGAAGEAGSCSCSTELPPSSHCALQNLLPLHRAAHDIDNSTLQSMFNSMRPCPRDAPSLPLLDRISDFFGYAASDVSGEVGAAAEPALVGPQLAPVWLINVARWLNPF